MCISWHIYNEKAKGEEGNEDRNGNYHDGYFADANDGSTNGLLLEGNDVFSSDIDDEDLENAREEKKILNKIVEAKKNLVNSKHDIDEEGGEKKIYYDSDNPNSPITSSEGESDRKSWKRKIRVRYLTYNSTSSSDVKDGMTL